MKRICFTGILMLLIMFNGFTQKKWVVAQDGSGDFKTVQSALDAIKEGNNDPVEVFVKKGVYREVVVVDARKSKIHLVGEDKTNTIISFDNHAGTRKPN